MDAADQQISQSILSGIINGNDALEQWSCEWVCDRPNSEFMLLCGCGNTLRGALPKQRIWPEVATGADFRWIGTDYNVIAGNRRLLRVFGGCRYDLGILDELGVPSAQNRLRHLIELKRYWDIDAESSDLTRLARALYYLGYNPNREHEGVQLYSVFFGAFLYCRPGQEYPGLDRHQRELTIKADLEQWWRTATAYPGEPELISSSHVRKSDPGFCWVLKQDGSAGAVCVCLSIDRPAQAMAE
jgi:hypothetical protein